VLKAAEESPDAENAPEEEADQNEFRQQA